MNVRLVSVLFVFACLVFHFGFQMPFRMPKVLGLAVMLLFMAPSASSVRPSGIVLFLLLWPMVSLIWIINTMDSISALTLLMLYAAALLMRPHPEHSEALSGSVVWVGLWISGYLMVQKVGLDPIQWEVGAPPGSFFGNPNICAHVLVLALCTGRFSSPYQVVVLIVGVGLCNSRGAWLALCILGLIRAGSLPAAWRKTVYAGALLVPAGLGWAAYQNRTGLTHLLHPVKWAQTYEAQPLTLGDQRRLQRVLIEEGYPEGQEKLESIDPWFQGKRMSLVLREILWGNSLVLAADRPVAGWGLGQFHVAYPQYSRAWAPDISMGGAYRAESAHNLVLDAIIQLGIPWLAALLWLLWKYWQAADSKWRTALGLQMIIALFSLNYLEPVIVTLLLLTAPKSDDHIVPSKIMLIIPAVMAILLALFHHHDLPKPGLTVPELHARAAYEQDKFTQALLYQIEACRQDPWGPETLYNLYLIAGQQESTQTLSLEALALVRHHFPNYEPARDRVMALDLTIPHAPDHGEFMKRLEQAATKFRGYRGRKN